MAKTKRPVRRTRTSETKAKEVEPKGMVALSVRLTEEQGRLIAQAAEIKGWTPTNLLRVAVLEKAAHITNTSTLTKFDFKNIASRVADVLFRERRYFRPGPTPQDFYEVDLERDEDISVEPAERLPDEDFDELTEAARLGGSEFLSLVIDFSQGITLRRRANLPDPVDPTKT